MRRNFDQLKALITADKPLTADNIYTASLIILLPDDWMPCVASILNDTTFSSAKVIAALKAESLRRKTRMDEGTTPILVSKANAERPGRSQLPHNNSLYCSYCKRPGHDLKHF